MKLLFSFSLVVLLASCATIPPPATKTSELDAIAHEFWEHAVKENPTWATYVGDHRFDHNLPDWSMSAKKNRHKVLRQFQNRLSTLSTKTFNTQQTSTYAALEHQINTQLSMEICQNGNWVVDQLEGPQVWLAELPNYHLIHSTEDAVNLITRYHRIGDFLNTHTTNLRAGLSKNLISPKQNVELVLSQLNHHLTLNYADSPFMNLQFSKDYGQIEKNAVIQEALYAVQHVIFPALQEYRDFLQTDILPQARQASGVSSIPNGDKCYAALINHHTGLDTSAEEIHNLGVAEVRRIKLEMTKLANKMKPGLSLSEFIYQLRNDPAQFSPTKEELIRHNEKLLERAQMALRESFLNLPKTPVAIKPIEAFREKEAPAAYYYEATGEAGSSAYYYLNTHKATERPLYNMAALAFHEAVPGHHFQIALSNENAALPMFQRKLGQTAFIEGWALYAESLAGEMGLYHTPEEKMGAYNYELWRALRLVVDTGLHAKNWTRGQAINYLATETALPPHEVTNEIDRYIIWPGQALAYKIGQLTISELRKKAKETLGSTFSMKKFHHQILKNGPIPLEALKSNLNKWMHQAKS